MRFPEKTDLRLEPALESPALAAGLQIGDRAVELDGVPLSNFVQARCRSARRQARPDGGSGGPSRAGAHPLLLLTADAKERLGFNSCTQMVVHSYGEGFIRVLVMPSAGVVLPAQKLIRRLRGEPPLPALPMPKDKALREARAYLLSELVLTDAWALFLLFAGASQVVAWLRGEVRAPAPSGR